MHISTQGTISVIRYKTASQNSFLRYLTGGPGSVAAGGSRSGFGGPVSLPASLGGGPRRRGAVSGSGSRSEAATRSTLETTFRACAGLPPARVTCFCPRPLSTAPWNLHVPAKNTVGEGRKQPAKPGPFAISLTLPAARAGPPPVGPSGVNRGRASQGSLDSLRPTATPAPKDPAVRRVSMRQSM